MTTKDFAVQRGHEMIGFGDEMRDPEGKNYLPLGILHGACQVLPTAPELQSKSNARVQAICEYTHSEVA